MRLVDAFADRALAIRDLRKIGGIQLQVAVPMTLGHAGTAVAELAAVSGPPVNLAGDLIEASSHGGVHVTVAGGLMRIAVKLSNICNDLPLVVSGSRSGFKAARLPATQARPSFMRGNVGPVIVLNVLQSLRIRMQAMDTLADRCARGNKAHAAHCMGPPENSLLLSAMPGCAGGSARTEPFGSVFHTTHRSLCADAWAFRPLRERPPIDGPARRVQVTGHS